MTEKLFEVAGTSTQNGVTKVRFANDYVGRFKILAKNEHTNIELIELGDKFSKAEICQILMQHEKFQSEEQQSAIAEFVVRNTKAPKAEKAPKVAKVKSNKTQLEQDIEAAVAAARQKEALETAEEAPF
jgi:homogentisate 1,2-dioxygenase